MKQLAFLSAEGRQEAMVRFPLEVKRRLLKHMAFAIRDVCIEKKTQQMDQEGEASDHVITTQSDY